MQARSFIRRKVWGFKEFGDERLETRMFREPPRLATKNVAIHPSYSRRGACVTPRAALQAGSLWSGGRALTIY